MIFQSSTKSHENKNTRYRISRRIDWRPSQMPKIGQRSIFRKIPKNRKSHPLIPGPYCLRPTWFGFSQKWGVPGAPQRNFSPVRRHQIQHFHEFSKFWPHGSELEAAQTFYHEFSGSSRAQNLNVRIKLWDWTRGNSKRSTESRAQPKKPTKK